MQLKSRPTLIALAAGCAGFALNTAGISIFGGTELVFGGFLSLLVAFSFGPWLGALTAAIAFTETWLRWQHPAGLICFTLEAVVVGWLVQRRGVGRLRATLLYWVACGGPLIAAYVGWLRPDIPFPADWSLVLKYPLNGLLMAAIALPLQNSARLRRWAGLPLANDAETPLQHVLFRRFGVITALPLVLLILLVGHVFDETLRRNAAADLQDDARELGVWLDQYMTGHQRELTTLALQIQAQHLPPEQLSGSLAVLHRQYPGFLTLLAADPTGAILASAPATDERGAAITRRGLSVADRPYFSEPMRTGAPYTSGVFQGRGFGNALIVAVSTPIPGEHDQPAGLLEGSIDLGAIRLFLTRDSRFRDRIVVIADRAEKIVLTYGSIDLAPLADFRSHPLSRVEGPEGAAGVYDLTEGAPTSRPVRQTVIHHRSPQLGWHIVLLEPIWKTQRAIAGFYLVTGAWAVVAIGLALLLARSTASDITEPLQHLVHTTSSLAQQSSRPAGTSYPFPARELSLISRDLRETAGTLLKSNADLAQAIADRDHSHRQLRTMLLYLDDRIRERTRQLDEARAAAESANLAKSEFLASMSHELRTPLNVVLGMSETLRDGTLGPLNPRQLESITGVEESGRHLLALINDILDLSKIEAGKMHLNLQEIGVSDVGESSLRLVRESARRKSITLESAYHQKSWHVHADGRRLKQILVNLLSNAVKFTPEGGRIRLEVRQDETAGMLNFTVEDNGIGIPPEHLPKLFQVFQQIDSALNRRYAGTGLGLALVRRMTELHGGTVAVTSEVGRGSRFTVSLPLTPAGSTPPGAPALLSESPFRPAPYPGQPLILVAEDNATNRLLLESHLLARGCRLAFAHDGQQALALAASERPDLILMDVQMPEIDGLEATRRLRADPLLAHIPIITLTALAMSEDRIRCLEAGASAYLSKPVSLRELDRLIHELLAQRAAT